MTKRRWDGTLSLHPTGREIVNFQGTSEQHVNEPPQVRQGSGDPRWTPWFIRLARDKGWLPASSRQPRPPVATNQWWHKIHHPIWTAFYVLFGLAAFGSTSTASSPVGEVILGVICLAIAAQLSGFWRRR